MIVISACTCVGARETTVPVLLTTVRVEETVVTATSAVPITCPVTIGVLAWETATPLRRRSRVMVEDDSVPLVPTQKLTR